MKSLLRFFTFAILLALALPGFAQTSITSSQCVTIGVNSTTATVGIQVTGTWTGTLQPEIVVSAGQAAANVQAVPSTSSTPQATITANGIYTVAVAGSSTFLLCGNTVASGTAVVYLNISSGPGGASSSGGGATSSTITAPLGSKASASSVSVVIASDQGAVNTSPSTAGTTGSAVPAKADYIGGVNGGNTVGIAVNAGGSVSTTAAGTPSDGVSNLVEEPFESNGTGRPGYVDINFFNGSTWDRARTSAADSGGKTGQLEVAQSQTGCYIATATVTACKATAGILHRIAVNTGVASATIKLFDLASGSCTGTPSTNPKGVITLPGTLGNPFFIEYNVTFANGICILTSGATDLMVVYQ